MKTKAVVLLTVALVATARLFATEYYVDAENGNDAYDGSSATRGAGDVGPKETLAGAMEISGLKSGDIVYAAEGFYTNRTMESSTLYRVVVPQGVKLIASGRADRTFIVGAEAPAEAADRDAYGNGSGAVRCAYLAKDAHVIGFTLTGGRTPATAKEDTCNGGAVYGTTATFYVTDCIVSNNIAYHRGGAFCTGGVITRCLLTGNRAPGGAGQTMTGGKAYNCLCLDSGKDNYHFYYSDSYNCTFAGPGRSIRKGTGYNCISLVADGSDSGGIATFSDSYLVSVTAYTVTNNCVKTTAAALALDENYRPKLGSVAIDAGNPSRYTLPAAVGADKDFSGGARVIGSIDVGALEYDWRALTPADGIEYSIATVEGGEKLSVRRNFTSEKLVTGFTYGSDTVMFEDLAEGVWETTVPAATNFTLQPIYAASQKDWYVNPDPTKGNDANKGYHPDCPRRTLKAAMELAQSGDTVHAAPGHYEDGVYTNGTSLYRVRIPSNRRLVASGRADETFIMGAAASADAPDRDSYGNGTNSIRCALLDERARLVGFTITGGRTPIGGNGGGVGGEKTAFVMDCILSNNVAQSRGGAINTGPKAVRCLFRDNRAPVERVGDSVVGSDVYNCVFAGPGDTYHVYSAVVYGCTFVGSARACRSCSVYNSILFINDSGKNKFYRCLLKGPVDGGQGSSANDGTLSNVSSAQLALDENYRPVSGNIAIDAGSTEYLVTPTVLATETAEKLDFAKGRRIYNGAVDIGAGEFDWRGVFGAKLRPGDARAQVLAASENVTTNVLDGIVLNGGDSVEVAYAVRTQAPRICTFRAVVTGEGTVTARLGDEVLVPDAAGLYTYRSVGGDNRISLSFEGSGRVVVSNFAGPHIGAQFIIR